MQPFGVYEPNLFLILVEQWVVEEVNLSLLNFYQKKQPKWLTHLKLFENRQWKYSMRRNITKVKWSILFEVTSRKSVEVFFSKYYIRSIIFEVLYSKYDIRSHLTFFSFRRSVGLRVTLFQSIVFHSTLTSSNPS